MSIILDGTAGITTTGLLTGTNATIGNVSSSEIDALSSLGNVTPSRVIISNAAGKFVNSPTTLTEVGYLSGVTSSIQTQLGKKVEQTTNLIDGTNLNNVITSGFYRTQTFTPIIPNATQAYGQLVVSRGGDTVVQIYTDWQAARSFMRTGSPAEVGGGGVWSQWKMLTPIYDGDAPIYACRAWVNFNGTGTVAIRASGNVSSITDNGVGDYTVNFTTAMPDANYSIVCSKQDAVSYENGHIAIYGSMNTASSARILTVEGTGTGTGTDSPHINVSIFR